MWMKICTSILLSACLVFAGNAAAPECIIRPLEHEMFPPLPTPIEEVVVVDPLQLKCLQKNIYFEARNQGRAGMRAIAAVTMNRTADPRFPDTICEVVYQRRQFSWANRGDRTPNLTNVIERRAWKTAGEIAERALIGTLENNVKGAQYFHTVSIKPHWSSRFQYVATIGDHVFLHQPMRKR